MKLNGKTFESFRKLSDEFDHDCIERDGSCDECSLNEPEENGIKCFANWLDRKFGEEEQAADDKAYEAEWQRQMDRRMSMKHALEMHGFTRSQAAAITTILGDFVMKSEAEIKKDNEALRRKVSEKLTEYMPRIADIIKGFGKELSDGFKDGLKKVMKDQEEGQNETDQ